MINEEKYFELAKNYITKGFLITSDLTIDFPALSQAEKVFIYAITKEFSIAQSILDDISQKDFSDLENKLINDSKLLLLVAQCPDCYNKKSPNNHILKTNESSPQQAAGYRLYIFSLLKQFKLLVIM